jgi:hypothetical protein
MFIAYPLFLPTAILPTDRGKETFRKSLGEGDGPGPFPDMVQPESCFCIAYKKGRSQIEGEKNDSEAGTSSGTCSNLG